MDADTAHPLTIMFFFYQKDCNFQGNNTNGKGEGEKRGHKACSLEFQSMRKALRVINKMVVEKTASLF